MFRLFSLSGKQGRDNWLSKLKKKNSFKLKSTLTWYKGLMPLILLAIATGLIYFANNPLDTSFPFAKTVEIGLTPNSDILKDDVRGFPEKEEIYTNVDDGLNFFSSDAKESYVYTIPSSPKGSHTVSYNFSEYSRQAIEYLQVNTLVFSSGRATIIIELYEGNRLIGRTNAIGFEKWQKISEVFVRPNINDLSQIRTKVIFMNDNLKDQSGYTQIWIKLGVKK